MENEYPEYLERKLQQIWIGTFKLQVNLSRFTKVKGNKEVGTILGGVMEEGVQRQNYGSGIVQGQSFVDVVRANTRRVWKPKVTQQAKSAEKWNAVWNFLCQMRRWNGYNDAILVR
uniref:Uncharacterized protein n=1 Tax=Cajanus cajan TaxID=3821 RepID=A0A151SVX1_CAJCA|nr:hypothetical protein KK1_014358 [Cajanus cajan]